MKRTAIFLTLALAAFAGCHAQVPPSPAPSVVLTWVAGTTCTGSNGPCTVIISRAVCTGADASTCVTTYTPLNQTSPAAGLTYTDAAPPTGSYVMYVAQTVQNGLTSPASSPSNSGVPLSIPVYPAAPANLGGTQIAMLAPALNEKPAPTSAQIPRPDVLVARLVSPHVAR